MTDSNQESTEPRTDRKPTDPRTDGNPTRDDGRPMKMKEMDHTPPVEGPNRTFERANEGKTPRTDGGQRPEENTATERSNGEKRDADDEGEFKQKVKDMDHTPPVEGPNRTFERGNETDDDVGE